MERSLSLRLYVITLLAIASSGCDLAQGIFKAGMWVGIIIVVLVIALIMFVVGKMRR